MTNEFDKEIDSLLRQLAHGGETAFAGLENPESQIPNPQSLHIDADEISLFAENVLPAKARVRVTEHLADCDRCRKILSNVIAFNSETESENVHAKDVAAALPASIPWYKNLFAFPQLAYMMGALAILFSGFIGVLIIKNAIQPQNSSVAQIEKMPEPKTSVQDDESQNAAVSDNNSAMSNSSVAANSNTTAAVNSSMAMANTANSAVNKQSIALAKPNSNQAVREEKPAEAEKNVTTDSLTAVARQDRPDADTAKDSAAGNAPTAKNKAESRMAVDETVTVAKNEAEAPKKSVVQPPSAAAATTLSRKNISELPVNGRSMSDLKLDGAEQKDKKARKTSAEAVRTVSGKNFKRADGVWYDSAYNQQKTVNIRRGTDEYKKLDSGLRSIAENLGGTIVVVWKSKAYRIQ